MRFKNKLMSYLDFQQKFKKKTMNRIIVTRGIIRENIRREKLMNRFDQEEKRFQKKYGVD